MFGQSSSTPFGGGGGGFGQPQQNTFGQPQQQTGGFGGASPFGQQQNAFGAPAPAPGGFGGGFGSSTNTSPFGAPAPSTGFGQTSTFGGGSTFGAPAPSGGGLFGSSSAPTSTFGAPAPSTGFGASSGGGGLFGAPAPSGGLFGASSTPASTPFGGGSTFGAPAPAPTGFGGSTFGAPTTSTFGAPAPSGGLFGAAPAPAPFGAPAPSSGLFGAPAPATTGGLFGSPAPPQPGQDGQGTRAVGYQPTTRQDGTSQIVLNSISAMPQYENYMFEELRVQDYNQGNRGSSTPTASNTSGGFGFGSPAPAPPAFGAPAPGGFGAPAPAPGGFGGSAFGAPAPSGGLFGSTPAPAFGAPAPSGGLFGSTPAPAFGAPAPSGGLFGAPAPAPSGGLFGSSPAPAFGGGFGAAPAPAFGSSPAPAPLFGSPSPAPAFGAAPAPGGFGSSFGAAPAPSGGLFGSSTPAPAPFGAPAPGGFGGFGAKPPGTSLFGTPSPAPAGFGAFGSPAPAPFGAPAPSAFGAPAPSAFGAPPPTAQPAVPPNTNVIPQVYSEVMEQQLRALEQQKAELEKTEVWRGTSSVASPSTPTNLSGPSGSLTAPRLAYPSMIGNGSPASSAKIRPRAFPQTEPKPALRASVPLGRDNSSTRTPEGHLRSAATRLVIRPDSMKTPLRLQLSKAGTPPADKGPMLPTETVDAPPDEPTHARVNGFPKRTNSTPKASPGIAVQDATDESQNYYERVIGSGRDKSAEPITPMAAGTKTSRAPKLSKPAYNVSPSVDELASMSEGDLAAVEGFCVRRPGVGKVEWIGAVDVRDANLDDIVEIQHGDISVYALAEEAGNKPVEGSKLNRPAILTYYNMYPKSGPSATPEDFDKFERKLERSARKSGAQFLSYDKSAGEWKIRVQHFSRYAVDLDDDSEEEEEQPPQRRVRIHSPPQTAAKPSLKRKATPFKASRISLEDEDVSESMDLEGTDLTETDAEPNIEDIYSFVQARADEAYHDIFRIVEDRAPVTAPSPKKVVKKETTVAFDDDEGGDEPEGVLMPRGPVVLTKPPPRLCMNVSRLGRQRHAVKDVPKRNNKALRVAWHPNGSFLMLDTKRSVVSAKLVQYRPVVSPHGTFKKSEALLETQRECSITTLESNDLPPIYSLPRGYGEDDGPSGSDSLYSALYSFSTETDEEDAYPAFALLSMLLPSEDESTVAGCPIPTEARICSSVRKLLAEVTMHEVDADVRRFLGRKDIASAIFAPLAAGDLEKAIDVAAGAGYYHLASILSSGAVSLQQITLSLDDRGPQQIPQELRRILKDISGDAKFEDSLFQKGLSTLDWKRRLALRLTQNLDSSLTDIMKGYERDIGKDKVPYPEPKHLAGRKGKKCLLYQVLLSLATPSAVPCEAIVDPEGYTSSLHDFSTAFHLAAALSAARETPTLSPWISECLASGYEWQLANEGHWEWAVFVCLCSFGAASATAKRAKYRRAKEIILRNYQLEDPLALSRRQLLEETLGVPSEWFHEALAGRAAYAGDDFLCLLESTNYSHSTAIKILEERCLPNYFYQDKSRAAELADWARLLAAEGSLGYALYRYSIIEEGVADAEVLPREQITELLKSVPEIERCLRTYLSRGATFSRYGLRVTATNPAVPVEEMVFEALEQLSHLKMELDAKS